MSAVLLAVAGEMLAPEILTATEAVFRLALPCGPLRLRSGAARPVDLGINGDARRLGIGLLGLRVEQGAAVHTLPIASPAFDHGFHRLEGERFRWTNGEATLPAAAIPPWEGEALLILSIMHWPGSATPIEAVPDTAALDAFESLGSDCELAFAQRHYSTAQPAGLLSWAAPGYAQLMAGLAARFDGVGDPERTHLHYKDREYKLLTPFFWAHSGHREEREDAAALHAACCARLRLQRRRLLDDIAAARRIFVFKAKFAITEAEMAALHARLHQIGPATLLCVTAAPGDAADGAAAPSVIRQSAGLYAATLTRFVLGKGPYDEWRTVAAQMLALQGAKSAAGVAA